MSFRDNLKSELTYQGILVKELSQKTGINKRTIDNYLREKSSTPPADIAVKIATVLNVTVEYLVNGITVPEIQTQQQNYNGDIRLIADKLSNFPPEKIRLIKKLVDDLEKI